MEPTNNATAAPAWSPADLETTVIGRRTAWLLAGGFLSILLLVPVVDVVRSAVGHQDNDNILRVIAAPPALSEYPFPLQSTSHPLPDPARRFEQALENASWLRGQVHPWVRYAQADLLQSSTTDVIIGEKPWLFFRPGIEHLIGGGFLASHDRSDRDGPLTAVISFYRQCRQAGAFLLVVPIDDKAAIESVHLTGRSEPPLALENPDAGAWRQQLTDAGVAVLPVTDLLRRRAYDGDAYLHQDTHWTPATMLAIARRIAFHPVVSEHTGTRIWRRDARAVTSHGDLSRLLDLPARSSVAVPQSVQISQVSDGLSGSPWASDPTAPVLLLGDSFTNIYQSPELGWGEHAGLGAQLAFLLRTTIDVIAINGDGFHAPREQLAARPSSLSGKRLVLWVFAERSLSRRR